MWVNHIPNIEHATSITYSTLGLCRSSWVAPRSSGCRSLTYWSTGSVNAVWSWPPHAYLGLALIGPGLAHNWWTLGLARWLIGFANGLIDVGMNAQAVGSNAATRA